MAVVVLFQTSWMTFSVAGLLGLLSFVLGACAFVAHHRLSGSVVGSSTAHLEAVLTLHGCGGARLSICVDGLVRWGAAVP